MLSAGGRFRFFIPRDVALRCDAGRFAAGEFTATVPWPLVAHGTRTCGEPCFTFGEARTAFPRGFPSVRNHQCHFFQIFGRLQILDEPAMTHSAGACDLSRISRERRGRPQHAALGTFPSVTRTRNVRTRLRIFRLQRCAFARRLATVEFPAHVAPSAPVARS